MLHMKYFVVESGTTCIWFYCVYVKFVYILPYTDMVQFSVSVVADSIIVFHISLVLRLKEQSGPTRVLSSACRIALSLILAR